METMFGVGLMIGPFFGSVLYELVRIYLGFKILPNLKAYLSLERLYESKFFRLNHCLVAHNVNHPFWLLQDGFYLPFVVCGTALAVCPIVAIFCIGGTNGTEPVTIIKETELVTKNLVQQYTANSIGD